MLPWWAWAVLWGVLSVLLTGILGACASHLKAQGKRRDF